MTAPFNTPADPASAPPADPPSTTARPTTDAAGTAPAPPTDTAPLAASPNDTAPPAGVASVPRRRRPIFATILFGVVLLAFAGFMVVWTVLPGAADPALWLLGGVVVIGLLLVVAGIAAASRRAD